MSRFYCNGKEDFCHKGNDNNVNCENCKYFNDKGGQIVETELTETESIDIDKWIISEQGCVITCPNCGERLELCYLDGTEVRYLPHCPFCGKKLEK